MRRLAIAPVGIVAVAVVVAFQSPVAVADVLRLKDGRSLEGDVKRSPDGWVVSAGGVETTVAAEDVASIDVGAAAGRSDDAGLASLRRSVEAVSDPKQAVDKYARFIATAKGPAAEAARADQLVWQDRVDRGLVKFAGKWVTPADADAARAQFGDMLVLAREQLLTGRAREAKAAIDGVLAGDPQDAAALYLRGVMAFTDGDVPAARRAFDASLASAPDHGPTLNNLAVVMMRQNQQPAALNAYARAMNAAPSDRRILDNVAEALTAAADDPKLAPAVKKTAAVFSPLDVALAQQLAGTGLFRWGATWVSQQELQRLQALEKEVADQLQQHERDFNLSQDAVRRIEGEIDANDRSMRRIEANSVLRDEAGRIVRTAYPPVYFRLQEDNAALKRERQIEQDRLVQIRASAKAVRAKIPTPRYTGTQRLIGPEGTPNLPPLIDPATPRPPAAPPGPPDPAANAPATATPAAGRVSPPAPALPADSGPPPRAQTP